MWTKFILVFPPAFYFQETKSSDKMSTRTLMLMKMHHTCMHFGRTLSYNVKHRIPTKTARGNVEAPLQMPLPRLGSTTTPSNKRHQIASSSQRPRREQTLICQKPYGTAEEVSGAGMSRRGSTVTARERGSQPPADDCRLCHPLHHLSRVTLSRCAQDRNDRAAENNLL